MSARDERFRRLRPPTTGDLFAHFGVALEPPVRETTPTVLVAHPCPRCRWYVTSEDTQCLVCGSTAWSGARAEGR